MTVAQTKITPKRIATRTKIVDMAQSMVLNGSFHSMSVDKLIEEVGISKGTFFYHFSSKEDLAKALVERFVEERRLGMEEVCSLVDSQTDDPLEQLLGLFEAMASQLPGENAPRGCLVASFAYHLSDEMPALQRIGSDAFKYMQEFMVERLQRIEAKYPPVEPVDIESLAEMCVAVLQGSLLITRVHDDPQAFSRQIRQMARYIRLLFASAQ